MVQWQPANFVTCANLKGPLKRAIRVGVARLELDVPSRHLHAPDCDGRRGGHLLGYIDRSERVIGVAYAYSHA